MNLPCLRDETTRDLEAEPTDMSACAFTEDV
jgi:hypothetical protein